MRPAVLVLDEPTSQLDPRGTQLVRDALVAIVRGGAAVLIAEHKTNLLEALSSRVVALEAGRVALSGTTEDVLEDPALGALGVEAPTRVRLRRALAASGLPEPAVRAARVAIEAATQS
jgi:energy-coupling factor transporter ATP-binding protein EcfA2